MAGGVGALQLSRSENGFHMVLVVPSGDVMGRVEDNTRLLISYGMIKPVLAICFNVCHYL